MLMEIYLSEEKAKKNNIDLNECYQKIDKYFKSRGVEIVSKGIYKVLEKTLILLLLHKDHYLIQNGF